MRQSAFKVSILIIAGILVQQYARLNITAICLMIFFSVIVILLKYKGASKNILLLTGTMSALISLGMLKSYSDDNFQSNHSLKFLNDSLLPEKILLKGIISEIPDADSDRIRFRMNASLITAAADSINVDGEVIADIRKNGFSKTQFLPQLKPGDEVVMKGKLSLPAESRNPGEFNYRKYLENNYIYKVFYVRGFENVNIITHNNLDFFHEKIIFPAKYFCLEEIDRTLEGDEAAYLKGLITGMRNDITRELKEAFVNTGAMHLIAVSGLNVAYIILSLSMILSLVRVRLIIRTVIIILFIIFYCCFTGNTASIVRASIMGIVALTAYLMERKTDFYNTIGISSICILLYDSKQLFDPGFILSFSAVLSMTFFMNIFEKHFTNKLISIQSPRKKYLLWGSALLFTSLSAQIGTIPITAIYFERVSVISIVVNIVAVPLANLSLAVGFLQMFAAPAGRFISEVIASCNHLLLSGQLSLIKWCADFEFAYFNVGSLNPADIFVYYITIVILFTSNSIRMIFSRIIISAMMVLMLLLSKIDYNNKLSVVFFDVGQGDCSLIRTPGGKIILVDCGRISSGFDSGERTIAPYLIRNSISRIDLLIITHLHNDHIGGVNHILRNFEVGKLLESSQSSNSQIVTEMNALISAKKIPRQTIRYGMYIDELADLRIYFLFPADGFIDNKIENKKDNLNNGSIAFLLKYRETEILFTGDIEKEAEEFIVRKYSGFLRTDVLKAAHHGSKTSSTGTFLQFAKPQYAVISCGLKNKFNHPSAEVIKRFADSGISICRTDTECAVIFESDGLNLDRKDWK